MNVHPATAQADQIMYQKLLKLATGPLTDPKISLYALGDPTFVARLPPIPEAERQLIALQVKRPFIVNPKATDRVLCGLAVRSWAREAAAQQMPLIRADLEREYWHGDPEAVTGQTRSTPEPQTLAPRTGLGAKIKTALGRFVFGPHDEEQ